MNGVLAASAASCSTGEHGRPLRVASGRSQRARCPTTSSPVVWTRRPSTAAALSAARVQAHYAAGTRALRRVVVETVLIEDWCQQFPTGLRRRARVRRATERSTCPAARVGASPSTTGARTATRLNPCGDPPGGVGATLTPPTAEGGWLRSQDLRTTAIPVGLGGTLIRVDKNTGAALPDNPSLGNADPNARRIVAYGLRNPYRMTIRPGTRDVWIGDVGAGDGGGDHSRRRTPADATVENFGWPCYEGPIRQAGFDAADLLDLREPLRAVRCGDAALLRLRATARGRRRRRPAPWAGLGHLGPRLRSDDRWRVSRVLTPAPCSSPTTRAIASGR